MGYIDSRSSLPVCFDVGFFLCVHAFSYFTGAEDMILGDIMTRHLMMVRMDDPLRVVQFKLDKGGIHHLLVMEGTTLVGIISDRDLLRAMSPYVDTLSERERDRRTLEKRAHRIMSRHLITAHRDMLIDEAALLMLEKDISCLPVLDERGGLEGIVTWRDLLRYYASNP